MLWLIVGALAGLYGLAAGVLYVKQRDLIYPLKLVPRTEPLKQPGLSLWRHELPLQDGQQAHVEAYFLAAPQASALRPAGLVVYLHGNGDTAEAGLAQTQRYHQLGLHVLVPEYRGYARSGGQPSEQGIVSDAQVFLERALARQDVDAAKVLFHGYSLGAGVACALARRRPPAAMILRSTFTGIKHIARGMGMPPLLAKDHYENLGFVRAFARPLLIIHGRQDTLLPVAFGQQLAQASPQAILWEHDGDHVSVPDPAAMWAQIERFMAAHHLLRAASTESQDPP